MCHCLGIQVSLVCARADGDENDLLSEDLVTVTVTGSVIEGLSHPLSSDGAPSTYWYCVAGGYGGVDACGGDGETVHLRPRPCDSVVHDAYGAFASLPLYVGANPSYSNDPAVYQILPRSRFQLAAAWNGDHLPELTCHNHWRRLGRPHCYHGAS